MLTEKTSHLIQADRALPARGTGLKGLLKRVVNKLVAWKLADLVQQQNEINRQVRNELNRLTDTVDTLGQTQAVHISDTSRVNDDIRRLTENVQMTNTLTENIMSGLSQIKAGSGLVEYPHQFDYVGFENQFRGSEDTILARQRMYVEYFLDATDILDIGCGRGEFLSLLSEQGIRARGVDINDHFVLTCREKGLQVDRLDALSALQESADGSLGGIVMNQVIEHIPFNQLVEIVALAYQKLKPGGLFIAETINPQSMIVFTEAYFLDPTHDRMIHPMTMQFLVGQCGFAESTIRYLSPVDPAMFLKRKIDEFVQLNHQVEESYETLNNLVYGCREYAVIGRK